MGFVSLRFHNASASTRHQRPCDTCLSKNPFFLLSFFFRNAINLCVFRQKHTYIDTLSILTMRVREDANFVFIVTVANFLLVWNLFKSCTPSHDWGQSLNRYRKTKVGAYNDKVPWGCRRFRS